MEKKLYWLIESNYDLSNTTAHFEDCFHLVKTDFDDLESDIQKDMQYTITPVWYTDKEYANLPED